MTVAATRAAPRRGTSPRRVAWLVALAALVLGAWAVHHTMPAWYARLWYPLRHDAVIREQAARHHLDPALVAAVINTESSWVPDTVSPAGAVGLMQLLPGTARFIATRPDRPSPPPAPLTDPQVNIAYGTWYLRYLIDRHGALAPALAAYNGGEANVRRWEARAAAEGRAFDPGRDIPFPETRDFVRRVMAAAGVYRRTYEAELGAPVDGLALLPRRSPGARALER